MSHPADEAPGADVGAIYALLSRIFLKEADGALLRSLDTPAFIHVCDALEPGFAAFIQAGPSAERLEAEAVEYARLFLLPKGVTPFAAGWLEGDEGAIRADLEERISTLYELLRVRPTDFGLGNVPSDHVGMLLALTAAAYGIEPSGELASQCLALLRPWGVHFGTKVAETSESPLYRASGRLLAALLEANSTVDRS